jgi:hypothetical protein
MPVLSINKWLNFVLYHFAALVEPRNNTYPEERQGCIFRLRLGFVNYCSNFPNYKQILIVFSVATSVLAKLHRLGYQCGLAGLSAHVHEGSQGVSPSAASTLGPRAPRCARHL